MCTAAKSAPAHLHVWDFAAAPRFMTLTKGYSALLREIVIDTLPSPGGPIRSAS